MKSTRFSAVLLAAGVFCLSAPLASVAETVSFADAEFSKTARVGDHELQLANLARLYYKVIFTGAAVGLYLDKVTAPDALLNDVPKRLEFVYFGSLAAEDFVAAANESLADNLDSEQLEQLRDDIDAFNDLYVDIKKYDRYAISYAPDYGLELTLNDQPLGRIENSELAAAYYQIWFGDKPFNRNLKTSLVENKPDTD